MTRPWGLGYQEDPWGPGKLNGEVWTHSWGDAVGPMGRCVQVAETGEAGGQGQLPGSLHA